MRFTMRVMLVAALATIGSANAAFADKIVLANDEWQTSNTGFGLSPASATFAANVANFFTGGGAGSFLIVSDNFSLDADLATMFVAALTGAGHAVADSENVAGFAFDVATLLGYDGVFFALPPEVDQTVLIDYVNAGGNVYINGGTGVGGSAAEAADWNTFLNAFGLNFASSYNGIAGVIALAPTHPVLAGVAGLYQNNGNSISLFGSNPGAEIIASLGGQGLYAVYDATAIPEPASIMLLSAGLVGFAAARRRARRC